MVLEIGVFFVFSVVFFPYITALTLSGRARMSCQSFSVLTGLPSLGSLVCSANYEELFELEPPGTSPNGCFLLFGDRDPSMPSSDYKSSVPVYLHFSNKHVNCPL